MSGNCLFYNESHYYVLMTVGGCIIYTQIVLRKMNVIFCISLPSRTRAHYRDFALFAFTTFTELGVNIWQLVI